ncbi:MAG: Clp protease ClpP [Actinomycetota bacterium]|jgi:ATP-dependent Clp protease protease subunit|nr:Clp protease ClpP [Actinomycetota bacterium]
MRPNWYRISTEAPGPAIIYLYGTIGQDWWGEGNSALDFAKELDELGGRDIELHINSGGGDVFEGYAIYSAIKRYSGKVTSYNDGLAASAASFIALAADEYVVAEASFTMIHKAWTFALGNSIELADVIGKLEAIDEQLVGIYYRNSDKDADEIRDAMAAETWLTAEQAVEWGFASGIDEGLKAAASISPDLAKQYAHVPDSVAIVDCDMPAIIELVSDADAQEPTAEDAPQEQGAARTVALASGVYTLKE